MESARCRDALAIHRLPVPTPTLTSGGDQVRATRREKREVEALRSHVERRILRARRVQAQLLGNSLLSADGTPRYAVYCSLSYSTAQFDDF